jgi:hypothetical protein
MKKLIYLLFVSPLFFSCGGGPSACDCANLLNTIYDKDGTQMSYDCAFKYGNLSDFEKEFINSGESSGFVGLDRAIPNAKKECNK